MSFLPIHSSFSIGEVSVGNHPIIHGFATTTTLSCNNNWGKFELFHDFEAAATTTTTATTATTATFFSPYFTPGSALVDDVTSFDKEIFVQKK